MDKNGIEKMLMEIATQEDITVSAALTLIQKLLAIDVKDKGRD